MGDEAEEKETIEGEEKEISDDEAEAAFAEGSGEEAPEKKEEKEIPSESEKTSVVEEKALEEKETPTEKKEKPKEVSIESLQSDLEQTNKRLEDTQKWATGLATENSQLKKEREDLKKTSALKDEPKPDEKLDEIPDDIKAFYEDYPEAQAAITYEAQKLVKSMFADLDPGQVQKELTDIKSAVGQSDFNTAVIIGLRGEDGNFVEGHPDAIKVMSGPKFKTYMDDNPHLGNITNPIEAIKAISAFKEQQAASAAKTHDQDLSDPAADLKDIASGQTSQGHRSDASPQKTEIKKDNLTEDEAEAAFAEGAA